MLNEKDEVVEVMLVLPKMTEPGVYRDVKFYLEEPASAPPTKEKT